MIITMTKFARSQWEGGFISGKMFLNVFTPYQGDQGDRKRPKNIHIKDPKLQALNLV